MPELSTVAPEIAEVIQPHLEFPPQEPAEEVALSDGTVLAVGAVADGQFVKRVGTGLAGASLPPTTSVTTADGAALHVGTITDNQVLKRSGTELVSIPLPPTTSVVAGGTELALGAVSDGQFVKRQGSALVGTAAPSSNAVTTSDGVSLTIGTVADGQLLQRSSSSLVGVAAPPASSLKSGTDTLTVGASADGQYLKRTGSTVVGAALPAPTSLAISDGTVLPLGALADGQVLARSGANIVGVAAPSGGGSGSWTPANLTPDFWWACDQVNMVSGSLDRWLNQGSTGANYDLILKEGDARATFDSSQTGGAIFNGGTRYLPVTQIANDWHFLDAAQQPVTILVTYWCTEAAGGSNGGLILNTNDIDSGQVGMFLMCNGNASYWADGGSGYVQGIAYATSQGAGGQWVSKLEHYTLRRTADEALKPQMLAVRKISNIQVDWPGGNIPQTNSADVALWRNGMPVLYSAPKLTGSAGVPARFLHVGGGSNGTAMANTMRIHEIVIVKRALPDRDLTKYGEWAHSHWGATA